MSVDVRSTFEALEPLDLKKCNTIGELVRAMGKCSFVARQIGEVAETLYRLIKADEQVALINSSGHRQWQLPRCTTCTSTEVLGYRRKYDHYLVVGRFGESEEDFIRGAPVDTIFINREGLCRPDQVQDGYFPDVVFEDPRFVLPVIAAALDEWLGIKTWTVTELFATLAQYGGVAAEVVAAARVLRNMVDDPDCTVMMTASGAMTVAQFDYLFCDMIEGGMIDYLATTGALMAHGLVKSTGCKQFKHRPEHGDALYAEQKINRVTDTLEPEENFTHIDEVLGEVLPGLSGRFRPVSPSELHREVGIYLGQRFPEERGILKSAHLYGVPVCVPAFVDSELGNDVFCYNARLVQAGKPKLIMDMERDSQLLMDLALGAKKLGIFSIGGGVPRNNTQNVAPLIEIYKARLGRDDLPDRQFTYGCRICPDPMWHGHLSGCTYEENKSWRKFTPDAKTAEVQADATAVWPFVLKWLMENRGLS